MKTTSRRCCRRARAACCRAASRASTSRLQMAHPDYIVPPEEAAHPPQVEPVYPHDRGAAGAHAGARRAPRAGAVPAMPEWQDAALPRANGWPSFVAALARGARAPAREPISRRQHAARQRLAYDELLANQLALALIREQMRGAAGPRAQGRRAILRAKAIAALPFTLTDAQKQAHRRNRRRHGGAVAHAAPAAGRCRRGQDRRRDGWRC